MGQVVEEEEPPVKKAESRGRPVVFENGCVMVRGKLGFCVVYLGEVSF